MKAMVLHRNALAESGPLTYEDAEKPSPGYGEVVMSVLSCGVCRSNLQVIEGERGKPPKLPLIPGHEVVGIVESVGPGVSSLMVGDRVGAQPQYDSCGSCRLCISGMENLCQRSGRLGWSVDGGYAQYMKGKASHLHKVPDSIGDLEAAPLFCPGVTAYRAVIASGASPASAVAVFGIGGVGHFAIQFARLFGARVIGVSRGAQHRKLALEMGADEAIDPSDSEALLELSRREEIGSSIVFAPSDDSIEKAMALTRRGGTIVLGVDGNIRNYRFMKGQTIKATLVGTRKEIEEVLEIAGKGLVKTRARATKLEDANKALCSLKENKVEGRIVLEP